jgi:hypothetical protein
MAMNRRNVLVGLGAVAVGGGAAFGSGAFSQVEAERTVNLQATGDNSALVTLKPVGSAEAASTNADGELRLQLTTLNKDATTDLGDEFTVTLNSDADTSKDYTVSTTGTSSTPLTITLSGNTLTYSSGSWDTVTASVSIDLTGSNTAGDIPSSINIKVS